MGDSGGSARPKSGPEQVVHAVGDARLKKSDIHPRLLHGSNQCALAIEVLRTREWLNRGTLRRGKWLYIASDLQVSGNNKRVVTSLFR